MKNLPNKISTFCLYIITFSMVFIFSSYISAASPRLECICSVLSSIIDGKNITGNFANATWKTYQNTITTWGDNKIQALYVMTNNTHLLFGIPGYIDNNCIVVLLDVNPDTGSNAIPSGLTKPERVKGMAGMRFDDAFTPDQAVSLGVNGGRTEGWPHLENIILDTTLYLGTMSGLDTGGAVITNDDTIVGATMIVPPNTVTAASEGIEIALSYEDINNSTPTVGVMVVLASLGGDWANNQTLPPTGGDASHWISSPSAQHDASLVPGNQYITVILPTAQTGTPFYATASKDKGILFAQSSIIECTASASAGVPPYSFYWNLGNGVFTNVQSFTFSYPNVGNFNIDATISDSGGNTNIIQTGNVKVYETTKMDGLNIPVDFANKGAYVIQDTPNSLWGRADMPGNGAQLDRLYAYTEGSRLFVGICGNLTTNIVERVLGIFIDSVYNVGTNIMPLITVGFPGKLSNLEGMTFDEAFTPDKAVLVSINTPGDFWVNVYHINSNSDWYWDTKTEYNSIFDPWQRVVNDRYGNAGDIVSINNGNTSTQPVDATSGLECYLDYDTLYDGLSYDENQGSIRIQAILFNYEAITNNVSNQSLPGINYNHNGYGTASSVNFHSVPGLQYLTVPINITNITRRIVNNGTDNPEIRITVNPHAESYAYAMEELLPDGLDTGDVGSDGVFDMTNRKVKWGVYRDNIQREVSYDVRGEPGVYIISGRANIDGNYINAEGDNEINIIPEPSTIAIIIFYMLITHKHYKCKK